jgi:hypothetical protein
MFSLEYPRATSQIWLWNQSSFCTRKCNNLHTNISGITSGKSMGSQNPQCHSANKLCAHHTTQYESHDTGGHSDIHVLLNLSVCSNKAVWRVLCLTITSCSQRTMTCSHEDGLQRKIKRKITTWRQRELYISFPSS